MKARILFIAIMTIGIMGFSFGQDKKNEEMKSIFGNTDHKIQHGGYGAISIGYTQIDGEDVMTLGGRAAWVIDHHVAMGFAGKAFMNSVYIDKYFPDADGYYLVGGYGGFFVEPIIAPNFPVHVSLPVLIGGGGLALNNYTWMDYNWDDNTEYDPYDYDAFFVVEPGVEIELNVVKFFRVAFGASYRFTSDLHMAYVPKDMMNGFNGTVTFKFGLF
jgi:hypothetical protein